MKLIFVRDGSAILLSEFGERPVAVGDVVALAANTLCGSEPEGSITVTTVYLDRDYVVDQVFWQHAALLADRLDAQDFADELYSEPARYCTSAKTVPECSCPGSMNWGSQPEWAVTGSVLPDASPAVRTARCRHAICQNESCTSVADPT